MLKTNLGTSVVGIGDSVVTAGDVEGGISVGNIGREGSLMVVVGIGEALVTAGDFVGGTAFCNVARAGILMVGREVNALGVLGRADPGAGCASLKKSAARLRLGGAITT